LHDDAVAVALEHHIQLVSWLVIMLRSFDNLMANT